MMTIDLSDAPLEDHLRDHRKRVLQFLAINQHLPHSTDEIELLHECCRTLAAHKRKPFRFYVKIAPQGWIARFISPEGSPEFIAVASTLASAGLQAASRVIDHLHPDLPKTTTR